MEHPGIRRSEDFRAGIAYAAHVILHSGGRAHGKQDMSIIAQVERRPCCQSAVLAMLLGLAAGLTDAAGGVMEDHDHEAVGA